MFDGGRQEVLRRVGRDLTCARENEGYSVEDVAEALDVSVETVRGYENGSIGIFDKEDFLKIVRVVGLTIYRVIPEPSLSSESRAKIDSEMRKVGAGFVEVYEVQERSRKSYVMFRILEQLEEEVA